MIEGVLISPLKQINDERGSVMHMMRRDSPIFLDFGEIYFSSVHVGMIKAWKRHKQMTLNCAAIHGAVQFILFDDRPESKTKGQVNEFFLSTEKYFLLTIPPLIWTGFKGVGDKTSIVANCATIPHEPSEVDRRSVLDTSIPYAWDIKHR